MNVTIDNGFVVVDGGRGPKGDSAPISLVKKYKAILSQSGTNNPIPIVLENTISSDLEWEFILASNYRLKSPSTPTGLFTLGKTFFYVGKSFESFDFRLSHSSFSGTANSSNVMLLGDEISPINSFTYLSVLIEIYP